jgi:hypothetical protein
MTIDGYRTWTEWLADNADADEPARLEALRAFIVKVARREVHGCSYTPAWANKKFAKLGITERIPTENRYVVRAPVSGDVEMVVYGDVRAEVIEKAKKLLDGTRSTVLKDVQVTGDFEFTEGPEDPDPQAIAADAPHSVSATLLMLREIIMLGHISGPHICEEESNRVLAEFGLESIPPRKTFTVTRPVTALAQTVVEAYDEASAMRVAGWRWEDGKTAYDLVEVEGADAPEVAESVNA